MITSNNYPNIIHDGGVVGWGKQKKIHKHNILHPQKVPGIKICYPPKNTRLKFLDTDLFNQALRPKRIHDRSLDSPKYWGCKFSTHKNTSDPPIMYTTSILLGIWYTQKDPQICASRLANRGPPMQCIKFAFLSAFQQAPIWKCIPKKRVRTTCSFTTQSFSFLHMTIVNRGNWL